MRLNKMIQKNNTLLLLGAGASFGSSYRSDRNPLSTPPLASTFLSAAKDLLDTSPEIRGFYKELEEYYFEMTGNDIWAMPDFETACRKIEAGSSSLWRDEPEWNGHMSTDEFVSWIAKGSFISVRDRLISLVAEVIHVSMRYSIAKGACKFHDALVDCLAADDSIISLNYDTIIERSLVRLPDWDVYSGYGGVRSLNKSAPQLYKPHGSINWRWHVPSREPPSSGDDLLPGDEARCTISLIDASRESGEYPGNIRFFQQAIISSSSWENPHFLMPVVLQADRDGFREALVCLHNNPAIIPPSSFKNLEQAYQRSALTPVWQGMYAALKNVDLIRVVGCSLSEADIHFRSFLQQALKERSVVSQVEIRIIGGNDSLANFQRVCGKWARVIKEADSLEEWYMEAR
jgi:hypothetical protein